MNTASLTVFFDDPFWVCVYERNTGTTLEACRIVFGAEPKDYEVYGFFLKHWSRLQFSPPVRDETAAEKRINPKRMQRAIHNQLSEQGVGTKAQQALKLQQEQSAQSRKLLRREKAELEKQKKFELHQQKKKEKHRGR
ncbi:MAG TPA: YjdF family protein [Caproiciproducens sp.]|nr:YjdF family protein [Caproiciproducens sp.]